MLLISRHGCSYVCNCYPAINVVHYVCFTGVTDPDKLCDDLPRHVGLWLDVFAFAAITIQTILFASPYWSYIRDYTIAQHLDDDTDR